VETQGEREKSLRSGKLGKSQRWEAGLHRELLLTKQV